MAATRSSPIPSSLVSARHWMRCTAVTIRLTRAQWPGQTKQVAKRTAQTCVSRVPCQTHGRSAARDTTWPAFGAVSSTRKSAPFSRTAVTKEGKRVACPLIISGASAKRRSPQLAAVACAQGRSQQQQCAQQLTTLAVHLATAAAVFPAPPFWLIDRGGERRSRSRPMAASVPALSGMLFRAAAGLRALASIKSARRRSRTRGVIRCRYRQLSATGFPGAEPSTRRAGSDWPRR